MDSSGAWEKYGIKWIATGQPVPLNRNISRPRYMLGVDYAKMRNRNTWIQTRIYILHLFDQSCLVGQFWTEFITLCPICGASLSLAHSKDNQERWADAAWKMDVAARSVLVSWRFLSSWSPVWHVPLLHWPARLLSHWHHYHAVVAVIVVVDSLVDVLVVPAVAVAAALIFHNGGNSCHVIMSAITSTQYLAEGESRLDGMSQTSR